MLDPLIEEASSIMETLRIETEKTTAIEQRPAWHKPEIQRLTIALDTANTGGSGADLATHGALED